MKRMLPILAASLMGLEMVASRPAAQPVIPSLYFTNACATTTTFHFESSADFGSAWLLEYKNDLADLTWRPYPLPGPGGRIFDVPLDRPMRFFRARNTEVQGQVYSLNMAYYIRRPLTNGFALLANPLDNGRNNRLSEIMPKPPPGTLACQFAPELLAWSVASQFVWDAWTPDLIWPPGRGLAFVLPKALDQTFAGTIDLLTLPLPIGTGTYLLGLPFPGRFIDWPITDGGTFFQPNDTIVLYNPELGTYEQHIYLEGLGWLPDAPLPALGEGYWFIRGGGFGSAATIHFNNFVPSAGIDAPISHAGRLLEGPNWLAQLYYSLSGPPDMPVGPAVPFRTGDAAGYVDTSAGGVVALPHPPGVAVNVQIRYWQTNGPGAGATEPIVIQTGTGADLAPPLPANLVGLGGASEGQQPHLSRPDWIGGQFRFRFAACLGSNYVIESSTSLTNWSVIRMFSDFSGPLFITDTDCACPGPRFYRAKPVPP